MKEKRSESEAEEDVGCWIRVKCSDAHWSKKTKPNLGCYSPISKFVFQLGAADVIVTELLLKKYQIFL